MKKILEYVFRTLLFLGCLVCLGFAISNYMILKHKPDLINFDLINPKSYAEVTNYQNKLSKEENPELEMAAWKSTEGSVVYDHNKENQAKVTLIELCGDASILYPNANLTPSDTTGCILTKAAAYDLYGSTDIEGFKLYNAENKEYEIRSVIDGDDGLVIVQYVKPADSTASGDSTNGNQTDAKTSQASSDTSEDAGIFDQITILPFADNESRRDTIVEAFKKNFSIEEEDTQRSFDYYKQGGTIFIGFFFILILSFCVIFVLQFIIRNIRRPFWVLSALGGSAAAIFILIWQAGIGLSLPQSWLPSKWSDMKYWRDTFKESYQAFQQSIFIKKSTLEIAYYNKMLSIMFLIIAAVFLWAVSVLYLKYQSAAELYIYELLALGADIFAIFYLHMQNASIAPGIDWLLLYPLYLLCRWLHFAGKEKSLDYLKED